MGTTINVHLHTDEAATVTYFGDTNWPHVEVKDSAGYPITDVAFLFEPDALGVVAVGVLDNDAVRDALTPGQLAELAEIVRTKAPQWVLAEAGLFKAETLDKGIRRAGSYEIELAGNCEHCGNMAGWIIAPSGHAGEAIHTHGMFSCAGRGAGHSCSIGGKSYRETVSVSAAADGADDELRQGWGFVHCSQCAADIGAGGFVDGSKRLRDHWADEHAPLFDELSKGSSVGYVKAYNGARSVLVK